MPEESKKAGPRSARGPKSVATVRHKRHDWGALLMRRCHGLAQRETWSRQRHRSCAIWEGQTERPLTETDLAGEVASQGAERSSRAIPK
jgi:hypothetical protein